MPVVSSEPQTHSDRVVKNRRGSSVKKKTTIPKTNWNHGCALEQETLKA